LQEYQKKFIEFLVSSGALKFGSYELKSGRISPYYFNSGEFSRGQEIDRLGYYYASAIRELNQQPTLIFGPAYKGIPLCIAASIAFSRDYQQDIAYSFDRKEVKGHGEGGWLVGQTPGPKDVVVLVDDVVTDGATKFEAIGALRANTDATVSGLVIAIDRKERNDVGGNSIDALSEKMNVEVRAIVTIYDILEHLPGREIDGAVVMTTGIQANIESYLAQYGLT
jgi:orotate phosphoribosyltransferase